MEKEKLYEAMVLPALLIVTRQLWMFYRRVASNLSRPPGAMDWLAGERHIKR